MPWRERLIILFATAKLEKRGAVVPQAQESERSHLGKAIHIRGLKVRIELRVVI